MRETVPSLPFATQTASVPTARSIAGAPIPIVLMSSWRSGWMRETVPSSALATQTEPCPIARATGLRPASTWPTIPERCVRLEPELLVQQPPARAVDLERVCLAAAAIEGQHQLAAQAFPQWLLAHEPVELGNQLRVAPQRELGLDPLLERGQPLLVQPRSLGAGE